MTDEPFQLVNDKRKPEPQKFDVSDRTRQKLLFAGLDCLPGQLDLFQTDGELPKGDSAMNLIRTAKGTFTINRTSRGWGVLNVSNGHVHECNSQAECSEWLQSHGPRSPGQAFPKTYNLLLESPDDSKGAAP